MLQLLTGIFLPGDTQAILKIHYKPGQDVILKSTHVEVRNQYTQKPVYILCDSLTYSAGEAFTYILKNRSRAIVIGQTTAGAGNVAGPYPVGSGFVLTVPVGTIADPQTNEGWEHTGVTPDVLVASSQALEKSLDLIEAKKVKQH